MLFFYVINARNMDNEKEKKDRIEEMLRGAWRLAYGQQILDFRERYRVDERPKLFIGDPAGGPKGQICRL